MVPVRQDAPTYAVQGTTFPNKFLASRNKNYLVVGVMPLNLFNGLFVFPHTQPGDKYTFFYLKEVQIGPAQAGRTRDVIVKFGDAESAGQSIPETLLKVLVEIAIVVHQEIVVPDGTDHSVDVAEHFIAVPGNEYNFTFKSLLQSLSEIPFRMAGILLQDFVCHHDAIAAFDDIASVNHQRGFHPLQTQSLADGLIWRDVVLITFEIVRCVSVLQKACLCELDRHIVPGPDMLPGIRMPEKFGLDSFVVECQQKVVRHGFVVPDSLGEIHLVRLTITDHIFSTLSFLR
jgi:hypothetical protein